MWFYRKCIVSAIFLLLSTIAPASLKLTIDSDINKDIVIEVVRFKRQDQGISQPPVPDVANQNQPRNGILDSIFSAPMGIMGSLRSLIPIGGNNFLNIRKKRNPNDYYINNNGYRVSKVKRDVLDNNANPTSNYNITNDTVEYEGTTESDDNTSSDNIADSTSVYNTIADNNIVNIQNDDMNATMIYENTSNTVVENDINLELNNIIVGNATPGKNYNTTSDFIRKDDIKSGPNINTTQSYETTSDTDENRTELDNYVDNKSKSDLNLDYTINNTFISALDESRDNSNATQYFTINKEQENISNNIDNGNRSAFEIKTQNNDKEIASEFTPFSNYSSKVKAPPRNLLNVTIKEESSNITEDEAHIKLYNNLNAGNENKANISSKANIFSNTRRSNSGFNNNINTSDTNTIQNISTNIKSRLNKIIEEIPSIVNAAANLDKPKEIILINSSANDTGLSDSEINSDSVNNNKNVNDRIVTSDDKDNVSFNQNGSSIRQITYINNLLVNFYFS